MAHDDLASDLVWEQMWVGRPLGTHFSADGASPLLRSDETNLLETQAVLGGPVDEDQESDLPKVLAAVGVGALLTFVGLKAVPGLVRRWKGRGVPTAELGTATTPAVDVPHASASFVTDFASRVEAVISDTQTDIVGADVHRRVVEVMLAAAVMAENVRALTASQLDDDVELELRRAMAALAAPDVVDILNKALAPDSALLDEQISGRVVQLFGGRTAEGRYLPLSEDRVAKVLLLSQSA